MSRVGISRDDFTGRARLVRNFGNQLGRYKAFAIILEDNRVGFLDSLSDRGDYFRDLLGRWGDNFLAIDTNHLLVQCDDPGFDNCVKGFILDSIGGINVLRS